MINWIYKKLTGNYKKVLLFATYLDIPKAKKEGYVGARVAWAHPNIMEDKVVQEKIRELSDYIAENWDLETFKHL